MHKEYNRHYHSRMVKVLQGEDDPSGELTLEEVLKLIQGHLDAGYAFLINPLPELRNAFGNDVRLSCITFVPESGAFERNTAHFVWLVSYYGEHGRKEYGIVSARLLRRQNDELPVCLYLKGFEDSPERTALLKEARTRGYQVVFG